MKDQVATFIEALGDELAMLGSRMRNGEPLRPLRTAHSVIDLWRYKLERAKTNENIRKAFF